MWCKKCGSHPHRAGALQQAQRIFNHPFFSLKKTKGEEGAQKQIGYGS